MRAALQAPADAGFCGDLREVVRIAASDRLASIGTGVQHCPAGIAFSGGEDDDDPFSI